MESVNTHALDVPLVTDSLRKLNLRMLYLRKNISKRLRKKKKKEMIKIQ